MRPWHRSTKSAFRIPYLRRFRDTQRRETAATTARETRIWSSKVSISNFSQPEHLERWISASGRAMASRKKESHESVARRRVCWQKPRRPRNFSRVVRDWSSSVSGSGKRGTSGDAMRVQAGVCQGTRWGGDAMESVRIK